MASYVLKLESIASGESDAIEQAVRSAVRIAKILEVMVQADINGVTLSVHPNTDHNVREITRRLKNKIVQGHPNRAVLA